MTPPEWRFRALATVGVAAIIAVAPAPRADARPIQPPSAPGSGHTPKTNPPPKTGVTPHPITHPITFSPPPRPKGTILFFPQANGGNTSPTLPINSLANPYAFNNPFANPYFSPNSNPYGNNPFALNSFNNPFVTNPLNNPFRNPFGPTTFSTPSIAIQQPGQFLWRGPDLEVNPWSGTVYKPASGVARTADGGLFFLLPGTGVPTVTGTTAPGTGLYYNPTAGTFFNPATSVVSKPGTTTFLPWIP